MKKERMVEFLKEKWARLVVVWLLMIGGFVWMGCLTNWKVSVAVFLIIWGNNLDRSYN